MFVKCLCFNSGSNKIVHSVPKNSSSYLVDCCFKMTMYLFWTIHVIMLLM